MNVADLFASLGVKADFESFATAHSALNKLEEHTKRAADQAKLADALGRAQELQYGDSNKALSLIGLGDGAEDAAAKIRTKNTWDWGKALVVANQALALGQKLYGGLAAGVGRVRGLADATGAQASQAVELSMQLGISAEAVQELGYAASQSGSSLEGMAAGMRGLANVVDSAANGGKEASRALREVGLSAKDIKSGKMTLDQAFEKIADHFKTMPDGAKKSALAMDLLTKQGRTLIPTLNEGSEGLQRLRQDARDTGFVIDNETAVAMEGFGDETDKVTAQFQGLRNQAIAAVLPMMSELVTSLQEWVKANRQLMVNALTGALQAFLVVLGAVGAALAVVVRVIAWFTEHSRAAIAALGGLTVALTYMGAAAAFAWLELMWPIVLIAAAIAALILLFPYLADAIQAGADGMFEVLGWLERKINAIGRGIESIARAIGRFFANIASSIKNGFVEMIDWIIGKLNSAIELVNKLIRGFNAIPFVPDISEVSSISPIAQPTIPGTRGGTAANGGVVDNRQASIVINAGAADAAEVERRTRKVLDEQLRAAYDGIG